MIDSGCLFVWKMGGELGFTVFVYVGQCAGKKVGCTPSSRPDKSDIGERQSKLFPLFTPLCIQLIIWQDVWQFLMDFVEY